MTVSPLIWAITIVVILALLAFDYFFHIRKAHVPTLKEAAAWSTLYVGMAVVFGVLVWIFGGTAMGSEYFAGYITEKALSVDNLFVFLIIIASFRVPREDQQKVLLFGIVFSLIARTGFIFLGAALINSFAWVFYIFGLILLITAGNLLRPDAHGDDQADNFMIRIARKLFHTTEHYDGDKLFTIAGRQAGADADAAGDGRDRRHRHPLRPRLHPGDLRADPERVHRLHRHGVLPDGPAPAVLPDRRAPGPPHLPRLRPGGHSGLHRRQAGAARPAREQPAVHQRRPAGPRHRDQHRARP